MMDYRKREERKGRNFRGGIQEVQNDPQCNLEWQVIFCFIGIILRFIMLYYLLFTNYIAYVVRFQNACVPML